MATVKEQKGNLKEQIYSAILQSIIEGEYRPESVLSEKILVERFHTSKSPIREAMIELCNEGVLRSIPRYGYEVIRLTERNVEDITQFRIVLECGYLQKYWHFITPRQIETLRNLRPDPQGERGDVFEHWANNIKFHLTLVSFYNNEYVYRTLQSSLNTLTRAYAQFYWDKWGKNSFVSFSRGHSKLVDYLADGDKEKAVRYLQKDISGFDEVLD